MNRFIALLVLVVCGCAVRQSAPTTPTTNSDAMIHQLDAEARRGAVVDNIDGLRIADPYRALEKNSSFTRRWMKVQTEHTERVLAPYVTPKLKERLETLLSIGVLADPALGGDRVFFTRRQGHREQPALFVSERGEVRKAPLVDPVSYGPHAALDWFYPSPEGKLVAFGISHDGDERSTLHVIDADTGKMLPDTIERTKWADVEWLPDGSGFYYTRYPAPGEPDYDAAHPATYFPRVFFHRLGTDPAGDPRVFGSDRGTDFPQVTLSEDGRWLVIDVFKGWSQSDVYLLDRGRDPAHRAIAPSSAHPLVAVTVGRDAVTTGEVHRGTLYLLTNDGAPRYRIAAVDPEHASDRSRWRDVVPEDPKATIDSWALSGDRIAVHVLENLRSHVRLYRLDGAAAGEVRLPGTGSVSELAGRAGGHRIAFIYSSYLTAPMLIAADVDSAAPTVVDRVRSDVDTSRYTLTIEHVRSKDGTLIPVQLVHRKDMRRDGDNPVLLTGYGGFNVSLLPTFTRNALYWLERGGVYAVANLRGGGEFGESWHRAGMLANKPKVFQDFEAVLRWLTTSGISRPDHICITGGSNGGLLMGVAITQAPDTFAAAASYVGLYDMVRFARFPPAGLWISEYGNPKDPAQLRVLYGYSPYHHVRDGVRYPAVLIETADHDTRVFWGHSTKFAARLQQATASGEPVLFYREHDLGHGAGTRLSDLVDQYARMYAFFDSVLGNPGSR